MHIDGYADRWINGWMDRDNGDFLLVDGVAVLCAASLCVAVLMCVAVESRSDRRLQLRQAHVSNFVFVRY